MAAPPVVPATPKQPLVIKKFAYTPERVFTPYNITLVIALKDLGKSIVLSNNNATLPLATAFLGKLVSLAVQPDANASIVSTTGTDVFVGGTAAKSFTIGPGTEVILRKVKLGWEIVTILVIPTVYETPIVFPTR